MNICPKCNGLGYVDTPSGSKICTCKVAETIKSVLAKHPNILMAKEKKFNIELFPANTVVSVASLDILNSILKTVFTYMFLKGLVKSIDLVDSSTLMDAYFDKNDYYSISSIKEAEFPVLIIEGEKQNKLLPEVIQSIASYRSNILGKPTWVVFVSDEGRRIESFSQFSGLVKALDTYKFTLRGLKK